MSEQLDGPDYKPTGTGGYTGPLDGWVAKHAHIVRVGGRAGYWLTDDDVTEFDRTCVGTAGLERRGDDADSRLRREVECLIRTPDGKREWHNQGRSGSAAVVDASRLRIAVDRAFPPAPKADQ